jgi:hypothetical protein
MAWLTTDERQKLLRDFFLADPAVGIDDYAMRWPKDRNYVLGLLRGTHFALETIGLAHGLFLRQQYDLQKDLELFMISFTGSAEECDKPAIFAAGERLTLALRWWAEINRILKQIG